MKKIVEKTNYLGTKVHIGTMNTKDKLKNKLKEQNRALTLIEWAEIIMLIIMIIIFVGPKIESMLEYLYDLAKTRIESIQ